MPTKLTSMHKAIIANKGTTLRQERTRNDIRCFSQPLENNITSSGRWGIRKFDFGNPSGIWSALLYWPTQIDAGLSTVHVIKTVNNINIYRNSFLTHVNFCFLKLMPLCNGNIQQLSNMRFWFTEIHHIQKTYYLRTRGKNNTVPNRHY